MSHQQAVEGCTKAVNVARSIDAGQVAGRRFRAHVLGVPIFVPGRVNEASG